MQARALLPWLATTLFVAGSLHAQQKDPKRPAPPSPAGTVVQEAQNLSWYPFQLQPPFIDELVEGEDTENVIYAGNATFTVEGAPTVPSELRKPLFREGRFDPGYFIVHFEDDLRAADKATLDGLTGRVEREDGSSVARWYVPNNGLVVFIESPRVLREVENLEGVDFIGRYEPAYKLDATIGSATLTSPQRIGRATFVLNLDLVPGHSMDLVARQLNAIGVRVLERVDVRGKRGYDLRFLAVEALPAQVSAVAFIEGVRTIQEAGDGLRKHDLSGGGKLHARSLSVDDQSASPIVTASNFPLWLTHDLQGQGQIVGVVDTNLDWNNVGTGGCNFGFPDTAIDNWGFALPNLARIAITSVGTGGVNLKIPRADELGGAALGSNASAGEHGCAVAGAACGDFYGNNDTKWWEHDVDNWEGWSPSNFSGLMGPGIAHEAQLYFTPVMNTSNQFRWEFAGEFETHMATTLGNMSAAGVSGSSHSVGLAESNNTYTQVSVSHDTAAYNNPDLLQCMAAGNDGAVANALSSQAVVKNAITVGASDDVLLPEDRVTFSSIGPRFDGALKPDIMAPGHDSAGRDGGVASFLILPDTNGTSSSASCEYQYTSGTSFSAPTITGATAIVHQYFEEGRYPGSVSITDPSAALMKGVLINGGHRLTGANLGNGQYPNEYQGWGEANLSDVLDLAGGSRRLIASDIASAGGFTSSGSANDEVQFTVNGSAERLRVTLVWTDEPGSAGQGKKLINDLDLRVSAPGGSTYLGNQINGSTGESTTGGSADTLNNVENVILSSPAAGLWTATIDPGAGNYASGQGYALVITGDVAEGGTPPAPVAEFSGAPTSGDFPLNVNFTDLSTGSIDTYSWNFGDTGTSTATNPSHVYTSAGTYTVSLTVTGPGGNDTETKTNYITVTTPPPAPVAEFSGSPVSGTEPLSVDFTDLSTGSITTYAWNFGDTGTSSAANPTHIYTSAGTYTVALTVTGPGGNDTETKVNYITVDPAPPGAPTAEFSGSPTSGTLPLDVDFTDQSSGSITSYAWDFGDTGTSSATNPSHTYTSAGTYTVTLTVTGPGGVDAEVKTNYITVNDPPVGAGLYYFSFTSGTSVPGVGTVADEDVVTYDPATGTWERIFDGSDVGVTQDVNAVHALADGTLVLSFQAAISVPGLVGGPNGNSIDDSDLVLFVFTQQGNNTQGEFQFIFDGSDVGLTSNGEDIDGVYEFPGGGLAISTTGSVSATGLGATARDEDVLFFSATQFGATTIGSFSLYWDGSDVGFGGSGSDDLNAVAFDNGVDLLFSTLGTYSGAGSSGSDEDVSRFIGNYGLSTSGTAAIELDLSTLGISTGEDVDGMTFVP